MLSINQESLLTLTRKPTSGSTKLMRRTWKNPKLPSKVSRVGMSCHHNVPLMTDQHIWSEEELNPSFGFAPGSPCGLFFPGNAAAPISPDVQRETRPPQPLCERWMKGWWATTCLKIIRLWPTTNCRPLTWLEAKHNISQVTGKWAYVFALRQPEDTPSPSEHSVLKMDLLLNSCLPSGCQLHERPAAR